MNWKRYISQQGLLEALVRYFGIISRESRFIYIDHQPDYDIISYSRNQERDYYFRNKYSFHYDFDAVIEARFGEIQVQAESELYEIGKILSIPYNRDQATKFIEQVKRKDGNMLAEHAFKTDMDQFRLHQLRVQSIDNTHKNIFYEGSFFGDHGTDIELMLFVRLELEGIPCSIYDNDFYIALLVESYLLHMEGKYKLSYFAAFSAFDSFINQQSSGEIQQDNEGKRKTPRLDDKLKDLLRSKLGDISKHQIHTATDMFLNDFITNRNTIAHGNGFIYINVDMSEAAIIYVFTIILCWKNVLQTFSELLKLIGHKPVKKR